MDVWCGVGIVGVVGVVGVVMGAVKVFASWLFVFDIFS